MRVQIFSILDKAVNAYLQPFYSRSKGEAVRSFVEACNDEKSNFRKHASDYVMFYLGQYDDATGLFYCGEPERVLSALECLRDVEPDPFTRENQIQ